MENNKVILMVSPKFFTYSGKTFFHTMNEVNPNITTIPI